MNLFCFTLDETEFQVLHYDPALTVVGHTIGLTSRPMYDEGSTDSIYEPASNKNGHEIQLPKCRYSPTLLRHKPEWGGSDPCISFDLSQTYLQPSKQKRNSGRSYITQEALDYESLEMRESLSQISSLTGNEKAEELDLEVTDRDLPTRTPRDDLETAEPHRRLKRFHRFLHARMGSQSDVGKVNVVSTAHGEPNADMVSKVNGSFVSCIRADRGAEKKSWDDHVNDVNGKNVGVEEEEEDGEDEGESLWSLGPHHHHWTPPGPPQTWAASVQHTCHKPRQEPCWDYSYNGAVMVSRGPQRDPLHRLGCGLESAHPGGAPPPAIESVTELDAAESTHLLRCGTLRYHATLIKQAQSDNQTKASILGKQMKAGSQNVHSRTDMKHDKALSEELTEETEDKVSGGHAFTRGQHRQSSNSLESLYSLNSGQSSSSGVTSGSDRSSNRDSLRLEEEPPSTRQFCGKARVHTDFIPSPYDTESLKLKIGDVIDVIAKPPMGIWRGMLNDRIGSFKFIYVDVIEEPKTCEKNQTNKLCWRSRPKTQEEHLKQHSLEECRSSLRLHGFQTIADLMTLRERHLTKLNPTDPVKRHHLRAKEELLQGPQFGQWENLSDEEAKTPTERSVVDLKNRPRDSGCHIPSDSSDNGKDTEIHFPYISPTAAKTTAI